MISMISRHLAVVNGYNLTYSLLKRHLLPVDKV